ncbi:conserved protein, unknown function [Plasmodium gallinaceum]|uniref:3'-phosphate/5'-hydroxy nucleic acid ligase n=1 Tax=Plasmodium gallinaceum TaxID=5849 RepID=A0A1J1GZS2_PLAGA|nr:conserved protein, unknown function [Plasmodium gallinaceum]CRG97783.1 conserved protein, unknown function [Plasmodium gallinaceum]
MKFFIIIIIFTYISCKSINRMFRICYINSILSIKKGENNYPFIKRKLKNFCSMNEYDNIKKFYGNIEEGFNSNKSPPYLLKFKNSNDVLAYTDKIDSDCLNQIKNLAKLKIIKGHVTILPDVHLGKGIIIGSVFLTKDFIIPNGVGVDIGCGILCVKINNLKKKDLNDRIINNIYNKIKKNIPLSFDCHDKEIFDSKTVFSNLLNKYASKNIKDIIKPKHLQQLGTLGGGNHFIEIVYDATYSNQKNKMQKSLDNNIHNNIYEDDINNSIDKKYNNICDNNVSNNVCDEQNFNNSDIYILIHSGSRNIGKTTAEFYDILASEESKMKRNDLAYLDLRKENGKNYIKDMKLCLEYAKYNRIYMMKTIEKIIYEEVKCTLNWENSINIHHNFCNYEMVTYIDKNEIKNDYMYVTRKGSTSSKKDEYGIIPGNMKTGSYIVKGKGNMLSYNSCSHGCGRLLSRTKAKQIINQNDFVNIMKGIKCDTNKKIRDEAPQAYKNINEVLKNQDSLIYVIKKLLPIINIKGF